MPLDTSTYSLALLRVDGRRWNDLRRLSAQIRTQAAADGSSYLEMGNTKVMCVVTGPTDEAATRKAGAGPAAGGGGGGAGGGDGEAEVVVNIVVAGFSSVDRKRRGRGDKRIQELQTTISSALAATLHTHLYPRSRIMVSLHVVSQDGSLLAALLNASTLALVDAGIPMADYLCACSAGSTSPFAPNTTSSSSSGGGDKGSNNNEDGDSADPLVDLNSQEEAELPSLTLATRGATDKVVVLVCGGEGGSGGRGVHAARLEGMMATAADGCRGVRAFLDRVVRDKGRRMVREGAVDAGDAYDDEGGMDVD